LASYMLYRFTSGRIDPGVQWRMGGSEAWVVQLDRAVVHINIPQLPGTDPVMVQQVSSQKSQIIGTGLRVAHCSTNVNTHRQKKPSTVTPAEVK
jgi:hypothetical protein